MKAKPMKFDGERTYSPCEPAEATHVSLRAPGRHWYRLIPLTGEPHWTWNGDTEKPTFKPSFLMKGKRSLTDEEADRIMAGEELDIPDQVCHSFITAGQIRFLCDSTHELAGQTLDLFDID